MVDRLAWLLGKPEQVQFQNPSTGAVMTTAERELALKATTQLRLGMGIFLREREFKAQFCKDNGITEAQLTTLVKALLAGE